MRTRTAAHIARVSVQLHVVNTRREVRRGATADSTPWSTRAPPQPQQHRRPWQSVAVETTHCHWAIAAPNSSILDNAGERGGWMGAGRQLPSEGAMSKARLQSRGVSSPAAAAQALARRAARAGTCPLESLVKGETPTNIPTNSNDTTSPAE